MKTKPNKNDLCLAFTAILIFILYSGLPSAIAQNVVPDSIKVRKRPFAYVAYTDFRNSFVLSDLPRFFRNTVPITIYGIAAGVEFRGLHQYTIGFYTLSKRAARTLGNNASGADLINERWRLTFASLCYTFTFLDKKKFELKLPLEIGVGKGVIDATDINNNLFIYRKGIITPFQFGFLINYRLTRWFGIQGLIGYRKTIKGSIFKKNFDSPFYSLGLSLNFENIKKEYLKYRSARKNKLKAS